MAKGTDPQNELKNTAHCQQRCEKLPEFRQQCRFAWSGLAFLTPLTTYNPSLSSLSSCNARLMLSCSPRRPPV